MSSKAEDNQRSDAFAVTSDMTSAKEALHLLLKDVQPVNEIETVKLQDALGRVLSRNVISQQNIPSFTNSAVDGFAVRFQDLAKNESTSLEITARIVAGDCSTHRMENGQSAQIFTGAPIPEGADTVIPLEVCDVTNNKVKIPHIRKSGLNVRYAGEDIKSGDTVLKQGTGLRPVDVAYVASVGEATLDVFRKLSIAVFSTGGEIVDPSDLKSLQPGQRFDSNRSLLISLCQRLGCTVTDFGILEDNLDVISETFNSIIGKYDLILTSGGVSSSEEDHVKQAFEDAGGALDLWKVAIRPGRPLAWGKAGNTRFMGLPGNPVAAFVTYTIFARPLISKMSGLSSLEELMIPVRTGFEIKKRVGRREWLRVWLRRDKDNNFFVEKFPSEGSGILSSVVLTDGLLELPDEIPYVEKNTVLEFLPFSNFTAV